MVELRVCTDYETGAPVGVQINHTKPGGELCATYAGWVPGANQRDPNEPQWQLISLEPLTISPSVVCRSCPLHGFVSGGVWH
jgi:hypothetical protein